MAERRCISKQIVQSDAFLDMPLSAQALYFHLNLYADDEGFINSPKRIARIINASEDDLKLLIMKRFLIPFESGVVVIKHWKIHNTLRQDRLKPTVYQEELTRLIVKPNGSYTDCTKIETLSDILRTNDRQLTDKCPQIDRLSQVNISQDNVNKDKIIKFKSIEDGLTDEQIETLVAEIPYYDLLILYIDKRLKEMPKNPYNYILACARNEEWQRNKNESN